MRIGAHYLALNYWSSIIIYLCFISMWLFHQIYVGALSAHYEALSVEASKATTAEEIVSCIVDRLILPVSHYYYYYCKTLPTNRCDRLIVINFNYLLYSQTTTTNWQRWLVSAKNDGCRPTRNQCRWCCSGRCIRNVISIDFICVNRRRTFPGWIAITLIRKSCVILYRFWSNRRIESIRICANCQVSDFSLYIVCFTMLQWQYQTM